MERLTERGEDGKYFVRISGDNDLILGAEERLLPGLEKWTGWWEHTVLGNIVDRLAAYEDILGDKYDLDRLRELVQADREGRCFVFRFGFGETVYRIWVYPSGKPAFVTENRMDTLNDLLNAETWNNAYKTRAEAEAALRREQE